jgi:hypothetical protein
MLTIYEGIPRDKEYLMNEFTRATRDSDDKSEAVKRGNRTKLKVGFIPSGRLPEGFIHTKNEKSEMVNDKDPDRFPLLQKAVKLILDQTHTPLQALNALNDEWGYRTRITKRTGGNPLAKSTWYRLLSGTKYFGELHRKEGIFNSQLPKLMEKEDFERLQIIIGGTSTKRNTKKDWAYTGLGILCGDCDGTVIMDEKWQIICPICKNKFHKAKNRESCTECKTLIKDMQQPKILHYTYLVGNHKKLADGTRCKQSAVAVKSFEEQIDALLAKFTIPESFKNWAIKWLQNQHTKEVSDRTGIKNNLQDLDTNVQKQCDTLLDAYLKKLVTEEEYEKKKNLLLLEQEHIRRNLKETDKRADNWLELTEKTFNFACYARFWFAKGTNQEKREILATIGSNLVLKDKKLLLRQRKPFTIINGMQEKIEILLDVFEPNELLDTTTQFLSKSTAGLRMLRLVDQVRTYWATEDSFHSMPDLTSKFQQKDNFSYLS